MRIALRATLVVALLLAGSGATVAMDGNPLNQVPDPPPAPTVDAAPDPTEPPNAAAESARSAVRSTAVWLARGVDSWFGDRPFDSGGKVTDGRLDTRLLLRQGDRPDLSLRFNARFRLPNLAQHTYLFIGRDEPNELVADTPGALSRQNRALATPLPQDKAFFAGVAQAFSEAVDLRIGVRGPLRPYVQARWREVWTLPSDDLVEFRQTVFWTLADRFGATTALSYERPVSTTQAVRWLQSATLTQASPRIAWSSLLGAYQSFGDQRLLAVEALASGQAGSGVGASDLGVQTRWEQPVYRQWLIGGVVIGHFWPRESALVERRGAWALGANLNLRF